MKTVHFIRHAKSSWSDNSLKDIERPLNKRGLRDAPFMASLLRGKGTKIDAIISSPAVRAHTTATYFADSFGINNDQILLEARIYEAWTQEIVNIIQGLSDDYNSVLVFGHNPAFTSISNLFRIEPYLPNLPTCGIVKVEAPVTTWSEFNDSTARATALYYPKQYFD